MPRSRPAAADPPAAPRRASRSLTVFVADDHQLVREGVRALLERTPGMRVVGEAADGFDAVTRTERLAPDVAVVDLVLPGRSGLEVTREIVARCETTRVLVLSMHSGEGFVAAALGAGATGYVLKSGAATELVRGIRAVAAGRRFIGSPYRAEDHARLERLVAETAGDGLRRLTARQREVLRGVAAGLTNGEIAEGLAISVRTVESHRALLQERLGLRGAADLTRFALAHGLVPPGAEE